MKSKAYRAREGPQCVRYVISNTVGHVEYMQIALMSHKKAINTIIA
jgi:hypothetical protein